MKRLLALTMMIMASTAVTAQAPASTPAPAPATPTPTPTQQAYKPDPIATTAEALQGKLFFNDLERARTDKIRKDLADGKVVTSIEATNGAPVLTGFLKRSDGATTYWINGSGVNDTRFVPSQENANISATSTMVGGEPKFVLAGTTVGEKSAVEPKAKEKKANAQKNLAKKNKAAPTKKRKKNKQVGTKK